MTTILPPFPRVVFTILEPLSLIAGWLSPILNARAFVSDQVLHNRPQDLTLGAHVVALQLGNVYLLLAMVGVGVLYATTEPQVVRNYVIALAVADIGHLVATASVVGYSHLFDVGSWNAMAWGNVGATAFLFVTRMAYLLGLFGEDRVSGKIRQRYNSQHGS